MDEIRKMKPLKHIPFDLIVDKILPKLPVKSLLRFTSTCKTRLSTIKSPHFVVAHLNLNRSQNKGECILIVEQNSCRILSNDAFIELAKFKCPFTLTLFQQRPQSCNGLIFLRNGRYLMWNPSIRKSKMLDTERFYQKPCGFISFEVYGLGFHELTNDHRLVRIGHINCHRFPRFDVEVDVYSLNTNSWHKIDSSPGPIAGLPKSGPVFVQGAVHWFIGMTRAHAPIEHSLLLFDFGDERFREIELPEDVRHIQDPLSIELKEIIP